LELTRDIAERFNFQFGKPYFELPKPLLTEFPKIMSTAEPAKKMSKSLGEKHYINLFADEAKIRKQIQSAVTDTGAEEPGVMSAGVSNLFTILKACGATEAHESLMANYNAGTLKYSELKPAVADALVKVCNPIRERFLELDKDKKQIKEATKASSEAIRKVAQATMREVKELVGLPNTRN
jgi:tryptophanyl-tRNA synthetase